MSKIRKLIAFIKPPPTWLLFVIVITGVIMGLGLYILTISKAFSYLSDDPKACVNCHIMVPQYATWQHSSHRENATCNDCHVPHNNIFNKYYFKAKDGLRHATIFTFRGEAQSIQITDASKYVVQENCKRCHDKTNENVSTIKVNGNNVHEGSGKLCFECHREVPHGRVNSLSSVPFAGAQLLKKSNVPDWMKNDKKNKKKK